MEFKGTKGEWHACCLKDKPHFLFSKDGDVTICGFYQSQDDGSDLPIEEVRANALLISKAPEMLDMLIKMKEALLELSNLQDGWDEDYEQLEQLILEATEI